jgi:thiol-disulfide isomerase/thioredoxin
MKLRSFLVVSFIIFLQVVYAKEVSEEQAKKMACNFLNEQIGVQNFTIDDLSTIIIEVDNMKAIYAFNISEAQGYVLLSAQDNTYPILGFSMEGVFIKDDQNYPIQFRSMLDSYKDQIRDAALNQIETNTYIKNKWEYYSQENFSSDKSIKSVTPLLETSWNQGCYYNGMCPEHNQGPCGHVYAGCVATAMGQVMKHYTFPEQGSGSHSYTHDEFGNLSVNFDDALYNYEEMPLSISADNDEIAQLLYHCGVAVEMNYGYDGSGAYAHNARNAFVNYFNYSSDATLIYKSSYSNTAWEQKMRDQLDNGYPICYFGYGTGGHAFNCDGYSDENYFHFNWGWSGYYNGYYYLNSLNPGSNNFTESQMAIVDLYPDSYNNLQPPMDLQTAVTDNHVHLDWLTPYSYTYLELHNGGYGTSIGYNGPGDFDVAARFTPEVLSSFNGGKLTSVNFFPDEANCDYTIRVWIGADGTNMVVNQVVPGSDILIGQWNQIELEVPIIINSSEDLFIGYRNLAQQGHPAGADSGPANSNYGDLINTYEGFGWQSLQESYNLNYNWLISGFVVIDDDSADSPNTPVLLTPNDFVEENYVAGQGVNEQTRKLVQHVNEDVKNDPLKDGENLLGYNVYRNGQKINSDLITITEYVDMNLVNGSYTYYVTAVYTNGESEGSNESIVQILETTEDMVLIEVTTATWCTYCQGAALGVEELISNGYDVAVIKNHYSDSFENVYSEARNDYYEVSSLPTAKFNGTETFVGGSMNSMYEVYEEYVQNCSNVPRSYDLNLEGACQNGLYNVQVSVEEILNHISDQVKLHFCLTESNIAFDWQDMDHVSHVNRLLLPSAQGTCVDLELGESEVFNYSFGLEDEWMAENCELVVFVQDDASHQVLKTIKMPLSVLPIDDVSHFETDWEGNPYQPMTVIVDEAKLDDLDLIAGDEIGVFDLNSDGDEVCVGFAVVENTITAADPLTIVCSADDPSTTHQDGFVTGNELLYKYWVNTGGYEKEPVNAAYNPAFDQSFTPLGTALVSLDAMSTIVQSIDLHQGWNISSFFVIPDNRDMLAILSPVMDSDDLIKVIDESGGFVQNIPGVGWMNTIGNMSNQEGYYIKVEENTVLDSEGLLVELPFSLDLNAGWNIISYPVNTPQDAGQLLSDLIDEGSLIKVINESGGFIQDIPGVGWMNTIGDFIPGEGYYLKVNTNTSLTYQNAMAPKYKGEIDPIRPCLVYCPLQSESYYMPMHIVLDMHSVPELSEGDEFAVFDGDNCVGATNYSGTGPIIIVSGMEESLNAGNGFRQGAEFSVRFYDKESCTEYNLKLNSFEDQKFNALETWVGHVNGSTEYQQKSVMVGYPIPNPCLDRNLINYELVKPGYVTIELMNSQGQVLESIKDMYLPEGKYQEQILVTNLSSGVYFYRFSYVGEKESVSAVRELFVL